MENSGAYCGQTACPVRKYANEGSLKDEDYFNNLHLDQGIRDIVITLIKNGVETTESCEGGRGHAYPWPTVAFTGAPDSAGLRALAVAITYGFPVKELQRAWYVTDGYITAVEWKLVFWPPKDSQIWKDRDSNTRYKDLEGMI